jgi:DNA-directed RNA polymerase specialized sigma24 family protein
VLNLQLVDFDTDIGGQHHRFPTTRHSAIVAAGSSDTQVRQRALETIVSSYWKPAYKYIRIKWQASNEDAKDLTQGFFATAIEKSYFAGYDAAKASFQTFFRTCLDRFIANQKKAEQRLKRGARADHLSLDFALAEHELANNMPAAGLSPDEFFHREWVRSLFSLAVDTLQNRYEETGRQVRFRLFELYDLQDSTGPRISYASLADDFQLKTTDVTNYLAAARRDFRKILLEKLRELTGTEAEFQTEARALLGVDVK